MTLKDKATESLRRVTRFTPARWWRNAAIERTAWTVLVWLLFGLFVLGPLATVVLFSFTRSVFQGVTPNTLEWYVALFTKPELYGPLIRSFEIALIVAVIQLFLGTLIAYATVRNRIWGAKTLDAMSNITIALPSVVVGLALLAFYGAFGPAHLLTDLIFGNPLTLTFTIWIVVLAHVLETFPYMVRAVGAVLQKMDPNLEGAARSLGASKFYVFRTITLPQLRPGLVAGSVLVLSRSIAEFGATIIVVAAALRTAPIKIYSEAEAGSLEIAAAYSVVLMLVSFTAYLAMSRWLIKGWEREHLQE
ncbi:MAG TPA: ABC transporter permease [Candidatus Thermoplasmatota archaeon]|nr:ABC transporter permease [Candidatus Thermoplasmatota archaeon]